VFCGLDLGVQEKASADRTMFWLMTVDPETKTIGPDPLRSADT